MPHYQRAYKYGLSPDEMERVDQANRCQVCGDSFRPGRHPEGKNVDHDHSTGKARFVACSTCNWIIGAIEHPKFAIVLAALQAGRFPLDPVSPVAD
jgi:hypothetical protein